MKIKKELIRREIAGESFLIPLGKTVYDTNGLFVLTEVGAFLWDLLPEAKDEEELLRAVLETYDVSQPQAAADIAEFLEKLRKMEIL
jgi:hypothetical protein